MSENCSHDCSSCSADCASRGIQKEKTNSESYVKKVIGIISGKGGVGKSMITSLLASKANKSGYNVAVLDADITGPSIPKAFGLKDRSFSPDGKYLIPVSSDKGVKIMSINLLLEQESDPVIWRGPVIAGTVKQFWTDVLWGDVDFMFVDMPPGTGDVPLTIFQSLPVDGIVIVTTPQDLVSMIVEKAVKMAEMMNIPILGIVENMSYYTCPKCGEKAYIFGKSDIEKIAKQHKVTAIDKLPILPDIASKADLGEIESVDYPYIENVFNAIKGVL